MKEYTNCKDCPCLNEDYENGSWCNLQYSTDLAWVRKLDNVIVEDTPEMRSHQEDFELYYISYNCGLEKVIFNEGVFIPKKVGSR